MTLHPAAAYQSGLLLKQLQRPACQAARGLTELCNPPRPSVGQVVHGIAQCINQSHSCALPCKLWEILPILPGRSAALKVRATLPMQSGLGSLLCLRFNMGKPLSTTANLVLKVATKPFHITTKKDTTQRDRLMSDDKAHVKLRQIAICG